MRDVLESDALFDAKPAIMRAFQASKDAVTTKSKLGADFVERSEFRLLLIYLARYFELFAMFKDMDTGHDGRIDVTEFTNALGQLAEWGADIAGAEEDPEREFDLMDEDGGGMFIIMRFARWWLYPIMFVGRRHSSPLLAPLFSSLILALRPPRLHSP